jgi:hypothetical protein
VVLRKQRTLLEAPPPRLVPAKAGAAIAVPPEKPTASRVRAVRAGAEVRGQPVALAPVVPVHGCGHAWVFGGQRHSKRAVMAISTVLMGSSAPRCVPTVDRAACNP